MEKTIEIEIPLLTPELENGHDDCLTLLESGLQNRRGILRAHVKGGEDGAEQLCLHYDPNLISLDKVERIAREAGSAFTNRYRHERIAFAGMDAADAAGTLRKALERVAGVLHADVNYAAGLIFVAYDSAQVGRGEIDAAIGRLGYRVVEGDSQQGEYDKDHEAGDGHDHDHEGAGEGGHDHGSAPAFLPHWMQERWTLLLVGLAGLFFLIGWLGTTFFGLSENIALIFYILAYIAGGYDIATHAIPGLFKGNFDTDVLMLAAAAGAALLGEWAEGAFLLFLFSLGHAGEHYALDRARNAVNALGELMPKTARVRRGDQLVEEPVAKLQVGDVVVVRPGDRVPVDGEVVAGDSVIDQSPITGESVPVNKTSGDEVFAGTINQSAALDIQVTRLANDNTLSRVMQLVAEAQSQQSPTQQFTQKFTSKFVPAVLVVTLLVIIVPPLFDWMTLQESFYRAMLLLVAASPCALALGTPATVLAGIAQAARNGVLIKGGVHLENLGDVQVMAFDKTGTLTEGDFAVTDIVPVSGVSVEQLLSLTAAVEQQSNHPLALAIVKRAEDDGLVLPVADGLENVVGRGVKSSVAGEEILIGSLKLFRETAGHKIDTEIVQQVEQFERDGKTTMAVSRAGQFVGVLALADVARAGVADVLGELSRLGVQKVVMLTGDNTAVAKQIAGQIGVTDVRAELMPEDKLAIIEQLQAEFGMVAMTGDGVNDAPALATAAVGIAMGGAGTAVALETADVALMADDLGKLPFAVGLSRASRRIIKQNLAISLGVIGLLLLTSVVGLINLSGTVALHEGSTIVVVLNSLRLLWYGKGN